MSFPAYYSLTEVGCVLYIKHMVCTRGIRVVRRELEKLELPVREVRLGAATVAAPAVALDWGSIRAALATAGFALLENPERVLAERVRLQVAKLLRRADPVPHQRFLPMLARELGMSTRRLRSLFARLPHHESLLGYILRQRLTYAQELLAASSVDIGRIARQLGYNSLAHFSGQFRRFAQCAPSAYRQQLRTAPEAADPFWRRKKVQADGAIA